MKLELTDREFRLLLDMVYVGNWVMNSTREPGDQITEYQELEGKVFAACEQTAFASIAERADGRVFPSRKYEEGGIHEAISSYEDAVFYDILAEELSRRDMEREAIDPANIGELERRIDEYIDEFEANGMDHLILSDR
jgi:hypothetical protein